ncbi:MAG TPA: FixH family protein, partial [Gammaproteobacteria bacterium]|nr:FixH family protein [Gammaproteobacteria bacterium]
MSAVVTDNRPWYRSPWPWLLMLPPFVTVVFWVVVLSTITHPPSLVVDDYSKIGLAYQKEEARNEAAAALGLTGRLQVQRDTGRISLVLRDPQAAPATLALALVHPTDSHRDLHIDLVRDPATGVYTGSSDVRIADRRYVHLTPPDGSWRLAGT